MGRKMPEEDVRKIFRKFNYFDGSQKLAGKIS